MTVLVSLVPVPVPVPVHDLDLLPAVVALLRHVLHALAVTVQNRPLLDLVVGNAQPPHPPVPLTPDDLARPLPLDADVALALDRHLSLLFRRPPIHFLPFLLSSHLHSFPTSSYLPSFISTPSTPRSTENERRGTEREC
ncbi:hypothetical protein JCM3765_004272 [Sporobolomyces pararoseus]